MFEKVSNFQVIITYSSHTHIFNSCHVFKQSNLDVKLRATTVQEHRKKRLL